jgi:hypothetical protein
MTGWLRKRPTTTDYGADSADRVKRYAEMTLHTLRLALAATMRAQETAQQLGLEQLAHEEEQSISWLLERIAQLEQRAANIELHQEQRKQGSKSG